MRRIILLAGAVALAVALFAGCEDGQEGAAGPQGPPGTPQPIKVMFMGAEGSVLAIQQVVVQVVSAGDYPMGTEFAAVENTDSIPSLNELRQFDAVLAWTDVPPIDADSLGNRLADYVDAGGKVVLCTYALSTTGNWGIAGRIMDAAYSPLTPSGNLTGANGLMDASSVVFPPHPIFSGVDINNTTYWQNANYSNLPLAANATLLATDTNGNNLIAINQANSVIAIEMWPYLQHTNGHTSAMQLIANSVLWLCGSL